MQEVRTQEQDERFTKTVGRYVADDYRSAAVFEKHGIDFCCGGDVSLLAVCQVKQLDPEALLAELATAQREPIERSRNYAAWELPFLADYIVAVHHAYIKENAGPIEAYARKIAEVHGAHHPEVKEIATLFARMAVELEAHLREEEEVCFPAMKRAVAARKIGLLPDPLDLELIRTDLAKLRKEHDEVGAAIHTIRHLAADYTLPNDVCTTFALTYRKLKEFEEDLHLHVHLENNLLFLKAEQLG